MAPLVTCYVQGPLLIELFPPMCLCAYVRNSNEVDWAVGICSV
jgi:hypothetical protein